MLLAYFILSVLIALATFRAGGRRTVAMLGTAFFAVQFALAAALFRCGFRGGAEALFFTPDALGSLFFVLLAAVSALVFIHSRDYLADCAIADYRRYAALQMLLTAAITGAYFANNVAVTWIFLEATTLCAAGLVYFRHTEHSLEAAWKYVFVCSTGIAVAYLGILLLGTAATGGSLGYEALAREVTHGNPLYLKTAFVLILCGYSCKLEIFPLHTVGVDANFAAPAPASALISTGLVNAGFVAVYRIYRIMMQTEAAPWVRSVLLLTGVASLAVGAFFLRRTNNYKRFLSYSTVENMGIAAIGLGIGGPGVWAAVFHTACHTLVKSSLFLQTAVMHGIYDDYRINRIGDYMRINRIGAIGFLLGAVLLLAFPPSPLFVSELMILGGVLADERWWLAALLLVLLCIVIYSFVSRIVRLCYQPNQDAVHRPAASHRLAWTALVPLGVALVLGLWQPEALSALIERIVTI